MIIVFCFSSMMKVFFKISSFLAWHFILNFIDCHAMSWQTFIFLLFAFEISWQAIYRFFDPDLIILKYSFILFLTVFANTASNILFLGGLFTSFSLVVDLMKWGRLFRDSINRNVYRYEIVPKEINLSSIS